jgi:ribose 5-phosphate isomerase B
MNGLHASGVGVVFFCDMQPVLIIGADHAGFALKEKLAHALCKKKITVEDSTPAFVEGDDYPEIGKRVARYVARRTGTMGILICGSGVGMVIAANRIKGARAMLGRDVSEVKRARMDDDVNIICLSGWSTDLRQALKLVDAFVKTNASKAPRHVRRVKQLN